MTSTHRMLVLWALLLSGTSLWADAKPEEQPKPVALEHVTVIDVTGGPARADQTVILTAGRIADLGRSGTVPVPDNAEKVDGTNRFLIPGLWDMHVHIAGQFYLPLFVANGVTGVRDMHAFFPDMILRMRDDVKKGKLLGPRIVAAGALVDGVKPFWPGSVVAGNEDEGKKAVQSLKKRGADFIKVYSKLPRPAYLAIAAEAKKEGLVFAGHVPESIGAGEASELGQKSMEHFYGIPRACSTDEDSLRKEEMEAMEKLENAAIPSLMVRTQIKALDSFSDEKAKALFARFVKNGTWQVPTMTVLRAIASLDDAKFIQDPRIKYMPSYLRVGWNPKNRPSKLTPESIANIKKSYHKAGELLEKMHEAGVPILAGTDTTNPFCFPGFSLHDELALLVQEGKLTPLEALQCATLNPAKFLDMEKDLGTVEKGKIADLVLLQANPLDDIHNTTKIVAVFIGGRLLAQPQLEKMLADVEAANKK
jgi:imidazolonepropionase-like amidohydrolase